jgi:FKBP-type peptidyl-prolyl cis-trans isomerase SlyD
MMFHGRDESGDSFPVTILEVHPDRVVVDLNHPLAGEDLVFDVTVVGLREATPQEISHGHAHGEGHAH